MVRPFMIKNVSCVCNASYSLYRIDPKYSRLCTPWYEYLYVLKNIYTVIFYGGAPLWFKMFSFFIYLFIYLFIFKTWSTNNSTFFFDLNHIFRADFFHVMFFIHFHRIALLFGIFSCYNMNMCICLWIFQSGSFIWVFIQNKPILYWMKSSVIYIRRAHFQFKEC